MNAIEVREAVLSWLKNVPVLNGCAVPSASERGVVTGLMNTALRLNNGMQEANERRRQVLAWIFRDSLGKPNATYISAKELPDELWWALCRFTEAHRDQDSGKWLGKFGFEDDMVMCLNAILAWQRDLDNQLGFLEDVV